MCCRSQCKGCRWPFCAAISLEIVLFVFGISCLGAGIIVLLVNNNDRASRIHRVDDAVAKWNDASSPATSWEQFAKLNAYASLTPGKLARTWITDCTIVAQTIKLSPYECPPNVYHEEAARFASVKQLAFCGGVSYYDFDTCNLQVDFLVVQPKGTVNTSLVNIPNRVGIQPVSASIDMYDIEGSPKCSAGRRGRRVCSSDCTNKCARYYGGILSCSDYKCRTNTYVDNLAVKVTYVPGTEQFILDNLFPNMGPATHGANALPKGHTWTSSVNNTIVMSTTGPGWQYERLAFVTQRPERLTLTLRSSSDPWLAYMAATRGSGYFNINKGVVLGVSISLIVIGSILILLALALIITHVYGVNLYNRDSTEQPKGCFSGMAWRLAARIHSRNNASGGVAHVHVTQLAGPQAAVVPAAVYYTPTSYTSAPLPPGAMHSPSAVGAAPAGSVPYPASAESVPYAVHPGSMPYSGSPPNAAAPSNSTPWLTDANATTK